VSGKIVPRPKETVSIIVNGGYMTAHSRKDGHFTIHGLQPGVYSLDFHSVAAVYSTLKVKVEQDGVVKAVQYRYPGAPKTRAAYPLVVQQQAVP